MRKFIHLDQAISDFGKEQEQKGIKIDPKRHETTLELNQNKNLSYVEQVKKRPGLYQKPSSQIQKLNDKQVFLPSEMKNRSASVQGKKPVSKTFQSQIFDRQPQFMTPKSSERINKSADNSVCALLSYSYALPYKKDEVTDKLNKRTIKEVNQFTYLNSILKKSSK